MTVGSQGDSAPRKLRIPTCGIVTNARRVGNPDPPRLPARRPPAKRSSELSAGLAIERRTEVPVEEQPELAVEGTVVAAAKGSHIAQHQRFILVDHHVGAEH